MHEPRLPLLMTYEASGCLAVAGLETAVGELREAEGVAVVERSLLGVAHPELDVVDANLQPVIDADKCTECVGAFDTPKCVEICPVEGCIVIDPNHTESREELVAKYERLH
jgi:ferredoxin